MIQQFKSLLPSRVDFGPGKIQGIVDMVAEKSVLLLSDQGVKQCGITGRIYDLCVDAARSVHEFADVPPEPTEDEINLVVNSLTDVSIDVILAVGGGSVMDTAKLVAVMTEGLTTFEQMFAGQLPTSRRVELIMIPTTAGTGAESTPNAIVFRPSLNLKVGIVCDVFMPDKVVLDPELLTGLPAAITAATGMDALCHALECYVSNKANLFSDMMAIEATRLIFKSLKRCVEDGSDLEARADLLLAAFLGGACIAASGTNGVHALSYPLGGRYRIPHGISNAILLAPVFDFNKDFCLDKLAAVAHLTGADVSTMTTEQKADSLVQALYELSHALDIPATMTALGVPAEDLDSIVDSALQVKRLLDNNPKPLGRADIHAIYQTIL